MKFNSKAIIPILLIATGIIFISVDIYQINYVPETDVLSTSTVVIEDGDLESYIASVPMSTLSADEIEGLQFMVEEEKLAQNVYVTLYGVWGINIFNNIKNSEVTHIDAVRLILDKYEIYDPSYNNSVGIFENEELQDLYDALIEQGSLSTVDALSVGAAIEEIDIRDLVSFMDTDKEDILAVYDMLLLGSRNHLRAFDSQLLKNGVDYEAQYLTQTEYDLIANSDNETGFPTADSVETADEIDYTYSIVGGVLILLGLASFAMMKKEIN